jgi:hypothetical protein
MVILRPFLLLLPLVAEHLAGSVKPGSCSIFHEFKIVKNIPTSITIAIKKIKVIEKIFRAVDTIVVPVTETTTTRTTEVDTTVTSINKETDTIWRHVQVY